MTTLKSNFLDAAQAWYAAADKWSDFGASDTEPRVEFAEIIVALARGDEPTIPETARGWQLYTTSSGAEAKAAWALTKAAEKAVEAGKTDHMGLVRFVKQNGWD